MMTCEVCGSPYAKPRKYAEGTRVYCDCRRERSKQHEREYKNRRASWTDVTKAEWKALRGKVFERDGYRCAICGCDNRDYLDLDHIIPMAKGGKSTLDNLQTLCHLCNCRKKDFIYTVGEK